MNIKESLYRISRIRGLKYLGKFLYSLTSGYLSLLFWLTPEIRSVYLAGSMASGDIVPGLSDIDFVIVIKDLSASDEYTFIKRVEQKLKYLMPPFGKRKVGTHIVFYTVSEWELLGDLFLGRKFGLPHKVFEKDKIVPIKKYSSQVKGLLHFYKAQWRLENIQTTLGTPVKSILDIGLLKRAMNRTYLSALNGFNETNDTTTLPSSLMRLDHDISMLTKRTEESKNDSPNNALLIRLLHFCDTAITHSLTNSEHAEKKDESAQIDQDQSPNGFGESQALEFAKEISPYLKNESTRNTILVSRTKSFDYFLYDTVNYDLSEKLISHYTSYRKRSVRILSKAWFEQLYLNFPMDPMLFIKLGDEKPFLMKSRLDDARFIIEVYSTLPQLRSPGNLSDKTRYTAYYNKMLQLTRLSGNGNNEQSHNKYNPYYNISEEIRSEGNEYERFEDLKKMSLNLTDNLSIKLKSR